MRSASKSRKLSSVRGALQRALVPIQGVVGSIFCCFLDAIAVMGRAVISSVLGFAKGPTHSMSSVLGALKRAPIQRTDMIEIVSRRRQQQSW